MVKTSFNKVVLSIILIFSISIQAQWIQQANDLPDDWYPGEAIDACDNETAVFSAGFDNYPNFHSRLFKTTDAGHSWFELPFPDGDSPGIEAIDLSLVDSTNLWICTAYPAKILYTENNGIVWEEQFFDTTMTDFLNYIEMFDLNNGIAMGDAIGGGTDSAVFLKTIDGGVNWISVNDSAFGGWSGDMWRRLDFVNPDVGYFYESGSNPQYLYKTVNGGYNWFALSYPGALIQVLKFYNDSIGHTIDYDGFMYKTSDGGQTWTQLTVPTDQWGMDIEYDPGSSRNVWFADQNSLFYMQDGGETLEEQLNFTYIGPTGVRDLVFTDRWNGWALLDGGGIYHTTNGGHVIVPEELYVPHNTETIGPFTLEFSMNDPSGTWSGQKMFHYSVNDIQDSLELTLLPQYNMWYVDLPEFMGVSGTTELRYWLSFEHAVGATYVWPEGAPVIYNTMIFGPDTTAPTLNELSTSIAAHYQIPFEKEVLINSVWEDRFGPEYPLLHWRVNQGTVQSSIMEWFDSTYTDSTWKTSWKGIIKGQTGSLNDTVFYWVTARDTSQNQNTGMSEIKFFTTAKAEVIGDWEQADTYENISFWKPFSYGEFYDYNSGEFQWNTVIAEGLQTADWLRDTLRYERQLDFSQVDQAWLMVPMFYNLYDYNEGYLEISINEQDWNHLGYYTGQVSPTVYQYDLSEYAGEDSVYFLFHILHQLGNLWWMIDDIILHSDSTLLGIEDYPVIADQFQLYQNYPNPFNSTTTIQYELPQRTNVQITVYDLRGLEVIALISEKQEAGFQLVQWNASNVPSGIYFYRIRAGDFVKTRKMILLK